MLFTESSMQVLDVKDTNIVEHARFDTLNLISPTLSYTPSGAVAYQDSIRDIQHSVRTYKGKVFVLVSCASSSACLVDFITLNTSATTK